MTSNEAVSAGHQHTGFFNHVGAPKTLQRCRRLTSSATSPARWDSVDYVVLDRASLNSRTIRCRGNGRSLRQPRVRRLVAIMANDAALGKLVLSQAWPHT